MPPLPPVARLVDRRRFIALCAALPAAAVARPLAADAGTLDERTDLSLIFQEHGVAGTFVLYDPAADRTVAVNGERAARRYVPASTFKIANALIALETGVVKDESEIIPYGGKPQPFKTWEKDMSMREAIAASAVPIFQEIARRVGLERYRHWLDQLDYGNRQTGTALETFWLDGPLEISAIEQARFACALAQRKLSVSERAQRIVRDCLRLQAPEGRLLFGKTGWQFSSQPQHGWWTGWVERDGRPFAFALNIDIISPADAPKRVAIGTQMLTRLGVL